MRISDWSSDVCSSDLWNQLNRRMHTKLLLVDGVVGITGGRNYQDDYYDWDDEFNFRDRDLLVAGPVAREMAANFDAFWRDPRSVPPFLLHDVGTALLESGVPPIHAPEYGNPERVAATLREVDDEIGQASGRETGSQSVSLTMVP